MAQLVLHKSQTPEVALRKFVEAHDVHAVVPVHAVHPDGQGLHVLVSESAKKSAGHVSRHWLVERNFPEGQDKQLVDMLMQVSQVPEHSSHIPVEELANFPEAQVAAHVFTSES